MRMHALILSLTLALTASSGGPRIRESVQTPAIFRPDTVSVRIIGDVMLHRAQLEASSRSGGEFDFRPFLDSIAADLSSASLSVANMEFSLGGEPYSGYPCFSAPDSYAEYVRDCGVDLFLTANNHILDKGIKGLRRTYSTYEGMRRVRFTRSNPTMLRVHGINFAFINFTYGTNVPQGACEPHVPLMSETDEIEAAVKKARASRADFVVALPHWGAEYVLEHGPQQEKMAKRLVEMGVDAIVGAHPHVVQDSAVVRKVPVYYSIGNAVSNMSAVNTQLELMVTLRFVRRVRFGVEMLAPEHEWLWCSRPGGLNGGYCVIKVKDFIGRRDEWQNPRDYDRMMEAYSRISY